MDGEVGADKVFDLGWLRVKVAEVLSKMEGTL